MDLDKRELSKSMPELNLAGLVSTLLPSAVTNVPAELISGYFHSEKIGNYLLGCRTLGNRGSKVKEALHVLVGEKVAMKIIDKQKAQKDPYIAKNVCEEAELLQMVRHPNIVQLYEVIETDYNFYLSLELCSGGQLMHYVYEKHAHLLDEEETRKFMKQIVSALDHLHRAGIIHKDLKGENLLLDSNMDVKIIGFGQSNEEVYECENSAYAAPELLVIGNKEYAGKEVDIWSIGVNMYAMLTGHLYYGDTTALFNIQQENHEPLSSECVDLVLHLLCRNPRERITMEEIMNHPWMNEGLNVPFSPVPFPLTSDNIKEEIVEHVVQKRKELLKQELLQNRATPSTAVYHLLEARLARYKSDIKSSMCTVGEMKKSSSDYEDHTSPDHLVVKEARAKTSSLPVSPDAEAHNLRSVVYSNIRRFDSGVSSLDSLCSPKLLRMPPSRVAYQYSSQLENMGRTFVRERLTTSSDFLEEAWPIGISSKEDQQNMRATLSASSGKCDRPIFKCKSHEDVHKALVESRCFHSRNLRVDYLGRKYVIEEHSITIMIPEGAIQCGENVEFITAVAMYGPFNFPARSARPISPILMICPKSHPNLVLRKPMEVTLPHYLTYLEEGDHEKYGITFAKADHTSKRLKFQPLRNKAAEVDMQFIMDGDQGYGILRSTHCCFLCITSCRGDRKIHMEQTLKAGYCLSRIEAPFLDHPGSVQITFYVSFMLSTCLEVLKSQFPTCNRTVSHKKFRLANSGTDSEPSLQIIINRESNDYRVVGVDPSNLKICSSHVEFWDKSEELQLLQETHQYPPRAKVTVHLTADSSTTPVTFPTRFLGCTEDSNLDVDIPLLLPHDSRLKVSKTLECVTGDLRIADKHLSGLFQQLKKHAFKWREIGMHLGFLPGELSTIEGRPTLIQGAPVSYLGALLEESTQWAPGDSRGSTSFTTLGSLKAALNDAGLGAAAHDLKIVSA